MTDSNISPLIIEKAPLILAEIQQAKSVLLHCHPSPDPDSVGSALAMKFVLEQMGKKATVIKGDSVIPQAFMHFPGADEIVQKNFGEVDLKEFDLFIIVDTASPSQISRLRPIQMPLSIKSIVIDHHPSNPGFADLNLIEPSYPATSQILFDLFDLWKVNITPEIAANLFMGIYTDTGGFKYPGTTVRTFNVAGGLAKIIPEFPKIISDMENSRTLAEVRFQALALSSIETFLDGQCGFSVISNTALKEHNIAKVDIHGGQIVQILRSVSDWKVSGLLVEIEPGQVRMSLRSRDGDVWDVSKLALTMGGGGHKAAAGVTVDMTIDAAKKLVVAKVKELYNL